MNEQNPTPAVTLDLPEGVQVTGELRPGYEEVLSRQALELIAALHRELEPRRQERLRARAEVVDAVAAGQDLGFLPETASVREDDSWRVAPPAPGLEDRRVEMTGPTDRKMTINAMNSGARVWLADQEDANTPMWANVVEGQINLRDAIAGTITFTSPEGKEYALSTTDQSQLPTIVMRPRGWHLDEKHITVDGERTSGSLVDFALYMCASARLQIDSGKGPYFYLPKMEHHLEARLWNDAFNLAQDALAIPRGTIRATCLVETYPAAFQMEEILHELRDHSAGLNAGRWDYLFSIIKTYRTRGEDFVLPDRNAVTMTAPMMRAYTELLVRTCHKRGAHAIGGMAAFIPSKDEDVNKAAYDKVRADKSREANDGFDGSWVAHPGMVPTCLEVFDAVLGDRPNQLDRLREDVSVTAAELLDVRSTPGEVTEQGLRANIDVGLQYLATWLTGRGAVGIHNLMEDAATAEISRSQVWQWIHNQVTLADTGETVTSELVERLVDEVVPTLPGSPEDYADATRLFLEVAVADDYADFLTVPAYEAMP
ncbi:malate synthase A [Ornithinimicrobium tianjinense]|uniref:Malate synthase n=1 Tax=Ornithinimicrobium tianjinense TaxID=1195761 RepID=A0A917BMJ0_9MICO|nr:malate synthase A [Ornithinimicrobium tianjinense]GGF49584.1 malate synthase [Ornithinimicrobium tianjinense]